MDLLDRSLVDSWIEILQRAKSVGFDILTSPVEPLLEVMVDLSLKLKDFFKQGSVTWEARSNKSLKFSEFQVDALSNPKVLTSERKRHTAWDPTISLFFKELAETLVLLKAGHKLPKHLYCKGKPRNASEQKEQSIEKRGSVYHFRRRTRLSKKK